jgi:hypothetical protein
MKKIILVEYHNWKCQYIPYFFLLKVLKKKNNTVESFITFSFFLTDSSFKRFIDSIKIFLGNIFSLKGFGFAKSIGVNKIFTPKIKKNHISKALDFLEKFQKKKNSRERIINLKINNVHVGDIIYDSYLKSYNVPTIKVLDPKFINFFKNFITLFFYWEDYFKKNNVKTVMIVHDTYLTGIPARIAISKKIKTIVPTTSKIYQLNKKIPNTGKEFLFYKNKFSKLKKTFKKTALKYSQKELVQKFKGIKFNYYYPDANESPFKKIYSKKKIRSNNKYKVLILTHSFIDSPNVFGGALFPDTYQWLIFLLKISKETNYQWYIKTHSGFNNYEDPTIKIVKNLIINHSNIIWLDSRTSHIQIINEGIDAVLTSYGSAGSEYPFFNIPVINASLNNPHIKYNFNIHPKSIKSLKTIIYDLPKIKLKINKDEIREYFFMHKILPQENWLGININEFIYKMGGEKKMYSNKNTYNLLMSKINEKKVLDNLKKFISTKGYSFEYNLIKYIQTINKL